MVDIIDVYNSLNITIQRVKQKTKMIKFVPDHLEIRKMCKDAVKKLTYLSKYVPDQYKTQQMWEKAILENDGTLKCIPDCCKNQKMGNKAVDNYPHTVTICYWML